MSSLLESVALDIRELVNELRLEWMDTENYSTNPTAFSKIKTSGANLMMCCPFHNETNPSFGVLRDYPYTYNCFGCGAKGNLYSLVAHALNLPTEVHGEYYLTKNWLVLKPESRPKLDIDSILDSTRDTVGRQSLPESALDSFKEFRHPYLYSRGFTERTLTSYEVGYDKSKGTMCMPVRALDGSIRFVQTRSVEEKIFDNAVGVYKKDIVYGLYYLVKALGTVDSIYLTESATDTLACYQSGKKAGALLGKVLFKEQVDVLLRAGVKEVNLLLDNDIYGLKGAYNAYTLLSKTPIRVNLAIYPNGHLGIDTMDEDEVVFKDASGLLLGGMLREVKTIPFELSGIRWSKFM